MGSQSINEDLLTKLLYALQATQEIVKLGGVIDVDKLKTTYIDPVLNDLTNKTANATIPDTNKKDNIKNVINFILEHIRLPFDYVDDGSGGTATTQKDDVINKVRTTMNTFYTLTGTDEIQASEITYKGPINYKEADGTHATIQGGGRHKKSKQSKKKLPSPPPKKTTKRVLRGGDAVGGMDMNAVYNVSGLITTNRDLLATSTQGVESIMEVPPSSMAGMNSTNNMSTNITSLITPSVGGRYYGGAAKKPKSKSKPAKDIKTKSKTKSSKEHPKKKK